MNNLLIIDKENSKILVRPTLEKWIVEVSYRKPRKSKKGYLGSKLIRESTKEFLPNYEANAIELFEQYKKKYSELFIKRDIIAYNVSCRASISYYVTCPKCGEDAEIISSIMMFCSNDGESMNICCRHCANDSHDFMNWGFNRVGICHDTSFFINREELIATETFNNSRVKWEDWEKMK